MESWAANSIARGICLVVIALLVLSLDQWVKGIVAEIHGGARTLIPGFLRISVVHNRGGLLGLVNGDVDSARLLGLISLLLVASLGWWGVAFYRCSFFPFGIGFAMFTGGILGNAFDRFQSGYVVDMIDIAFLPVFNLADLFLLFGMSLLLVQLWSSPEQTKGA